MKILKDDGHHEREEIRTKARPTGRRRTSFSVAQAGPTASLASEDVVSDLALAFQAEDEELALFAEESEGRHSDRLEPFNADEDILREFHRAVAHRGGPSLSGRML